MKPDIDKIVEGITIELTRNAKEYAARWVQAQRQNAANEARGLYTQLAEKLHKQTQDARLEAQQERTKRAQAEHDAMSVYTWLVQNNLYDRYMQDKEEKEDDE